MGWRTHDFVLQALILADSVAVAFAFVDFTIEVLDSLVVQQNVGMDSTGNHIAVIHLTAKSGSVFGENNTGGNYQRELDPTLFIGGDKALTIREHNNKDDSSEGPFE